MTVFSNVWKPDQGQTFLAEIQRTQRPILRLILCALREMMFPFKPRE